MSFLINPFIFSSATWLISANITGAVVNNSGWNGYTIRQRIDTSVISNTGGSQVRVTLAAGPAAGCTIDAAYIHHAAAAGDPYDFETTPVQLLFGGSGGVTISANATAVSDAAVFVIGVAKSLVVSAHFSAVSSVASRSSETGFDGYYKSASSDAATVNATGYTNGANDMYFVSKVESLHP